MNCCCKKINGLTADNRERLVNKNYILADQGTLEGEFPCLLKKEITMIDKIKKWFDKHLNPLAIARQKGYQRGIRVGRHNAVEEYSRNVDCLEYRLKMLRIEFPEIFSFIIGNEREYKQMEERYAEN